MVVVKTQMASFTVEQETMNSITVPSGSAVIFNKKSHLKGKNLTEPTTWSHHHHHQNMGIHFMSPVFIGG